MCSVKTTRKRENVRPATIKNPNHGINKSRHHPRSQANNDEEEGGGGEGGGGVYSESYMRGRSLFPTVTGEASTSEFDEQDS